MGSTVNVCDGLFGVRSFPACQALPLCLLFLTYKISCDNPDVGSMVIDFVTRSVKSVVVSQARHLVFFSGYFMICLRSGDKHEFIFAGRGMNENDPSFSFRMKRFPSC